MLKPPNGCTPTSRAGAFPVEVQVADVELVAARCQAIRTFENSEPVRPNSVLLKISSAVVEIPRLDEGEDRSEDFLLRDARVRLRRPRRSWADEVAACSGSFGTLAADEPSRLPSYRSRCTR
jgi:hypothetical protein